MYGGMSGLNDLGHNDQITCIAMSSPEEGSEVVNHMKSLPRRYKYELNPFYTRDISV